MVDLAVDVVSSPEPINICLPLQTKRSQESPPLIRQHDEKRSLTNSPKDGVVNSKINRMLHCHDQSIKRLKEKYNISSPPSGNKISSSQGSPLKP